MTVTVSTLAERSLRRIGVSIVPLDDSPVMTEFVPMPAIATMALQELGVIAADETPSASDQALALDKVKSVHAALDAQGVVWWGADAAPRGFAEEYTKLTASAMASSFGRQADPKIVEYLEQRVRQGVMEMSAHDVAVEAVMATHNHLVATNVARWSVFDIPSYAEMPYEMLAALSLGPKFDRQVDPQSGAVAMRMLLQAIALPTSGESVRVEYF